MPPADPERPSDHMYSYIFTGWDVTIAGAAADCNGDGKINGKDLILLRQYLAGWDVALG
ncbi:MAG: hypothetical protein IKC09_03780 [Oscillospiraceae bacterium]|nr:hypothetical protein [Oscillospiraceae bacterium]